MKKQSIRETLILRKHILEEILSAKSDYTEALEMLGYVCTRLGEYREGLEYDLKAARLTPADPAVYYNLACDYSLLGDTEEALAQLSLAVMFGYDDFKHMEKDADLSNLRKTEAYRRLKREHRRAA